MSVLQELGGRESVEMVRRYAHLETRHLANHAGNESVFGKNLVQVNEEKSGDTRLSL